MLKVKKQIQRKNKNNDENEQLRNDLKNSIKNLYISNQTKKKTIDEYAQLTTQIREEYAKFQKKKNLQIKLEKYKKYVEQIQPRNQKKYYEKPIRKRKYYKRDYEQDDSDDDSNTYITEISKRKKRSKKSILYEDEIDGISEADTDSQVSEGEQEQEAKPEINKNQKPKKN